MFLRRVISEPDDMDEDDQQQPDMIEHPPDHRFMDEVMHEAPVRLVLQRRTDELVSSSTLSADDEEDDQNALLADVPMTEAEEPPKLRSSRHIHFARQESAQSSSSGGERATSSQNSSRDWGWFEDVHQSLQDDMVRLQAQQAKEAEPKETDDAAAAMAVTAPTYVLEESLSSQRLWKDTAGQRPPQPVEERAFYERMWAQNFERSQVQYSMPVEVLTATSPISLSPFCEGNFDAGDNDLNYATDKKENVAEAALVSRMHQTQDEHKQRQVIKGDDGDMVITVKGDNVFGTTVSKSFARPTEKGGSMVRVDTVNISVASFRVVESKKHGKFAQFLVIYREGSIRDTVGVWKRYSDFERLANKVTQANEGCTAVMNNFSPLAVTEEPETEHLPNAITSWRLLKKRQRWYRCLDAGYLSLKVFLLERFLHDILFESSSPKLLREFVGVGKM